MNNITEQLGVVATIDPAALTVGAHNTDVVDMRHFERVVFIVATGILGTSATVDFAVKGDTTPGGSFATTVTGKTITQIVKATGDNVQALVELNAAEALTQGFRYVRGALTVGTATSQVGVLALGGSPRYYPASDNDLSSVAEIVAPAVDI